MTLSRVKLRRAVTFLKYLASDYTISVFKFMFRVNVDIYILFKISL